MELPNTEEDGMWAGPSEPNSIFGHLGGATRRRQKLFRHNNMVIIPNTANPVLKYVNEEKFGT